MAPYSKQKRGKGNTGTSEYPSILRNAPWSPAPFGRVKLRSPNRRMIAKVDAVTAREPFGNSRGGEQKPVLGATEHVLLPEPRTEMFQIRGVLQW